MLMHISADIIHYCIVPHLHVSDVLVSAASKDIQPAKLLDRVQYSLPHGPTPSAHYGVTMIYYCNGKIHRDNDEPAVICEYKRKEWYYHGKLHRIGGPAVEVGRAFHWYHHGKTHRIDGPAIRYTNWLKYEERHEYIDEYWVDNRKYSRNAYIALMMSRGYRTPAAALLR